MASTAESEGRLVEEVSLIDILYKDKYRVDSYIAQIMKGLLRRRKLQETESQSDTKNIGGSIKIFSGNFSAGGTDSIGEEKLFIPHDHAVNDLLDEFSAVAETLYREGNPKYTITPFLIFRGLEK